MTEKQQTFTLNIGKLILWAAGEGYGLTFGEAWRTPEQAALYAKQGKGIAKSVHIDRLAVDFNLFVGGKLMTAPESYEPLGRYWKSLHALNRWGGDFTSRDAVHFSMEHEGRK